VHSELFHIAAILSLRKNVYKQQESVISVVVVGDGSSRQICMASCVRQVKLSNPSSKPLIYQAILTGQDAGNFALPKGREVTIAPRSSANVTVEFRSRFMRSCEAVLVMAGRRLGATSGCSLVFTLRASINSMTPKARSCLLSCSAALLSFAVCQ